MSRVFPLTMLVVSAFCLAAGIVLAKGLVELISPVTLLAVQLGASVVVLWSIALVQGVVATARGANSSLLLLGVLVGLTSICTIAALRLTTASQASLIFASQPVLILAFAWAVLGERLTWAPIVLSLLALTGVVAVAGANTRSGEGTLTGNAFALLSTTLAALYVVWMRKLTATQPPLISLAILQTVALGLAVAAALLGRQLVAGGPARPAATAWIGAALSGVLQYGFGYWLYLIGLQRLEAAVAGLYLNLVPLFAVTLAFVFLGETLSTRQWTGAAAILGAVVSISLLELTGRGAKRD